MAVMAGLAAVSAVAGSASPGPGDMIAFTRCRELTGCGRGTDIWVMRPDATGLKVLTRYGTHNGSPSWSPDGRRIAFVSGRGGFDQIWTMKADGSDMRRLTAPRALDADPAWSPDGRRIAFAVPTGNGETIWVVDADGRNLEQVTANVAGAPLDPAWSPDGTWIAFFSGVNYSSAISLVHPDGTGLQALRVPPANRDGLAWSPDPGRLQLTYTAEEVLHSTTALAGGTVANVKVYDLATATETRVTWTSILSGTGATWSPDGTRISWWNDGTHTIRVTNGVADGNPTTVSPTVNSGCMEHPELAAKAICGPARWSPDSQWLFGPGIGGTAIVFELAGGTPPSHAITLDHPVDVGASSGWQVDWQSVSR